MVATALAVAPLAREDLVRDLVDGLLRGRPGATVDLLLHLVDVYKRQASERASISSSSLPGCTCTRENTPSGNSAWR